MTVQQEIAELEAYLDVIMGSAGARKTLEDTARRITAFDSEIQIAATGSTLSVIALATEVLAGIDPNAGLWTRTRDFVRAIAIPLAKLDRLRDSVPPQ
jgi:hypothetical protein